MTSLTRGAYPGSGGDGPRLFGLQNSNRDFSQPEAWGKNNFNSGFPASLCCWMHHRNLEANYLTIDGGEFTKQQVGFGHLFGVEPDAPSIYFAFESTYDVYDQYIEGTLPRTDLVVSDHDQQKACLEVKLTALPDSTTKSLSDDRFSSEIVLRPDTIFYLVAGLAHRNSQALNSLFEQPVNIDDWTSSSQVLAEYDTIVERLLEFASRDDVEAHPVLLQPIWKTRGEIATLADQCLDAFIWSSTGLLHFIGQYSKQGTLGKITRPRRSVIWIYKMLEDIAYTGRTDYDYTIDRLSFGTRNDKAMSATGIATHPYLDCASLHEPRVGSGEIHDIILGGGHELLRPERRFDAILVSSSHLFPTP